MTDYKSIIPLALNGDAAALDELYKSTCRAVYFTCLCLLKNEQDAEDLSQNTYITAFAKLKTLENPEKFEPWIKRIAANLCKDFLIKKGTHPNEPLDEEVFEEVDEGFLPEEYAEQSEKREIVMTIMRGNLSDVLYQTVILFYFDELTIAEIAEEMNCPEGTVKYRLNAARAKIKKGVLDYEKKSGDKLYAVVGVPFLALLLSRQAEAASVPTLDIMSVITQNAPYVPDSTAVDPAFANSAANTARRIGGKMFGTLKAKIIAGACAAAVVAGGVTAGVIIANKNAESGYTSRTESTAPGSSPNISGNEPENSASANSDYSSSQFWLARQVWSEPPREAFEGGILADNRKTLSLRELDGLSAPFYSNDLLGYSTETHTFASYRFADVLISQEIIEPDDDARVLTQYTNDDEDKPPYDGLGEIRVFNFDDEPRTAAYCFEQGWWKNIIYSIYEFPDETRALGLAPELKQTGENVDESAMLDAIKSKYGTPNYIRYRKSYSGDDDLEPQEAVFKIFELENADWYQDGWLLEVDYDMIYDCGDFIMVIRVDERVNFNISHKTDVEFVEFWSPQCWEHRRYIDPAWGGEIAELMTYSPFDGKTYRYKEPGSSGSGAEQGDSPFWFARQVWNEAPRDSFEGGLLIDNRKTINPEFLDSICAPYHCELLDIENHWGHDADKFTEVLMAEDDIPAYSFTEIYTQYSYDGEFPEFCGVEIIRVFNFDNIPHSVYDCYENGWWKITADGNLDFRILTPPTTALGLPKSLYDSSEMPNETALLEAIRQKFGTPDLVLYVGSDHGERIDRKQAMLEDIAKVGNLSDNETIFLDYDLLYNLDDVVMIISVTEQMVFGTEYVSAVQYVEFWNPLCLEHVDTVADLEHDTDRADLAFFVPYEP